MSLHDYLTDRVVQLEQAGQSRSAIVGGMAEAAGLADADVHAILDGTDVADLDTAEAFGRSLGLDTDEVLEQAADGTLMESQFVRFVDDLGDGRHQLLAPQLRASGEAEKTNDFIASTGVEARDGDIIDQASWRLGHYRRNPVVLDGHNPNLVVGRALKVGVIEGSLRTTIEWDEADVNPRGQLVAHQHRNGFRKTLSVRWITGKRTPRNELPETDPRFSRKAKRVDTPFGTYERMGAVLFSPTLLEQSSAPVPGDPRALQTRGLGPDAGKVLRGLDRRDAGAVSDLRDHLRALVGDESLWTDEALVANVRGLVVGLVRNDRELRQALRGLSLTAPKRTPEPTPKGDGFDHLYT